MDSPDHEEEWQPAWGVRTGMSLVPTETKITPHRPDSYPGTPGVFPSQGTGRQWRRLCRISSFGAKASGSTVSNPDSLGRVSSLNRTMWGVDHGNGCVPDAR